jgi:hypothetical protein
MINKKSLNIEHCMYNLQLKFSQHFFFRLVGFTTEDSCVMWVLVVCVFNTDVG